VAAKILKSKKIAPSLRLIIIPATQEIYHQALREGLFEIFLSAGAVISPPTCGPCLGGHMGVLAEGEKALATTNRNFRGRMGHARSEVYLSSPAVARRQCHQGKNLSSGRSHKNWALSYWVIGFIELLRYQDPKDTKMQRR